MKIFVIFNILIAVILLLRTLAQGRISRRAQYAMWIILPVYLLISLFAFQAFTISIPRKVEKTLAPASYSRMINEEILMGNTYSSGHPISAEDTLVVEPAGTVMISSESAAPVTQDNAVRSSSADKQTPVEKHKIPSIRYIIRDVCICGSILNAFFILINNIIFAGKVRTGRSYYGRSPFGNLKVYRTTMSGSPFLLGRNIYISRDINEGSDDYRFAVCHEYCHMKQWDSLWLLAEYIIICLFWFDPLVWYARKLMREDREMSVDEKVLSILGEENRSKYSETLLRFFRGITRDEPFMNIATTMSSRNRSFIRKRIRGIMKGTRKSLSVTIAISLILSTAVGCNLFKTSTAREGETVSADTPWYYCEGIECGREYEEYDFLSGTKDLRVLGKTSEGYVYLIRGTPGEGPRDPIFELALYSENGEKTATIDLVSVFRSTFPDEGNLNNGQFFGDVCVEEDQIKFCRQSNVDSMLKTYVVNISEGTITEERSCALPGEFIWNNVQYRTRCGNYELYTAVGSPLMFLTIDENGDHSVYSGNDTDRRDIPSFILPPVPINDHQIMTVGLNDYSVWCFDLQEQTMLKIEEDNEEYGWLRPYILGCAHNYVHSCLDSDGNLLLLTQTELDRIDLDNRSVNTIVQFENIDINRRLLSYGDYICSIYEATAESISFSIYSISECGFTIYNATRADQNPNAGKTIITTDGDSPTVYDAVYLFNNTDDEYFVRIVPYKYYDTKYSCTDYDLPIEIAGMYSKGECGNQMLVDLVAGDCPDVVFYASGYEQLNSGNCMIDLSEYYDSSDLKNSVFDNIVQACRRDGGLYSFPLNYWIYGITVDNSTRNGDGCGMSFDEFYDFTHNDCNGTNVIAYDQSSFMRVCLQNNSDLFINNGIVNFDCDAFRETAEYIANNVNNVDRLNLSEESFDQMMRHSSDCIGFSYWLDHLDYAAISYENAGMIGYPSPDGRGPGALITEAVSITKDTASPEGAWRFICMLCNSDMQRLEYSPLSSDNNLNTSNHGFPINIDAFDMIAEDTATSINKHNSDQLLMQGIHDEAPLIDASVFSNLKDIELSVDHIMTSDSDIEIIVYEEMQAYYCGDKTLDEVLVIMNDRAQRVLDERA